MPTFKISKSKNLFFYQEGFNKVLSDVMEHQLSLRKFSEYNNIEWVFYVDIDPKTQKIRSWFCEKTFDGYYRAEMSIGLDLD